MLLWEFPVVIIVRIAVWAGVGLAVHDFVFAPLCAALGSRADGSSAAGGGRP